MQTITSHTHVKAEKKSNTALWDRLNFNRYGVSVVQFLILGCIGGMVAATVLPVFELGLALIAITTVFSLVTILSVMPMKWVIGTGIVALVVDLAVYLYTLI